MDKIEIYNYLISKNICHKITEHKAVYTIAKFSQVDRK